MGLYLGRLVIGRIFASEIWGLIFKRAYFIYLFFIDVFVLEGGGGGLLSECYGMLIQAANPCFLYKFMRS